MKQKADKLAQNKSIFKNKLASQKKYILTWDLTDTTELRYGNRLSNQSDE